MLKKIAEDSVLLPPQAELKFKGQIFDVYQWPQTMFDGSTHQFEMLKRPDTVNVIGVSDGKILVINDEQPHLGARMTFPGGRVDPSDASTLQAAQREMQEETGYSFGSWRLISVKQPYRKIEWFTYLYLAWDGHKNSEPNLDPGEKISVRAQTFQEVKDLAINNTGYIANEKDLFETLQSLDELLATPEFIGQEIDR